MVEIVHKTLEQLLALKVKLEYPCLAPDAGKSIVQAVLEQCLEGGPTTPAGSQTCPHQIQHFVVYNFWNQ